jgi:hypothetical protein
MPMMIDMYSGFLIEPEVSSHNLRFMDASIATKLSRPGSFFTIFMMLRLLMMS